MLYNEEMEAKTILNAASESIKQTLVKANWWKFVQPEIRKRLNLILDNLGTIAIPFRDSFVQTFKFEHCRRLIEHEAVESGLPGALFGKTLPEEVYQSGILPTKMLLNLNDWIVPNEADVQACMHLIAQIDVFETVGVVGVVGDKNASSTSFDFRKT